MTGRHPSESVLYAVSEGSLSGGDRERAESHLVACPQCRASVREFRLLRHGMAVPAPDSSPEALERALLAATAKAAPPSPLAINRKDIAMHPQPSLDSPEESKDRAPLMPPVSPAKARAASRRGFLRAAAPLAVALTMGAGAGVWVTRQTPPPPSPDETFKLYQKADKAYRYFKPQEAVGIVRQAVRGELVFPKPKTPAEGFMQMHYIISVDGHTADYALSLAEQGQTQKALDINRLIALIGDQLLRMPDYHGIEAANAYFDELRCRVDIYKAAGDQAAAEKAEKELKRRQEISRKTTGKLGHELIVNRGLYLTWPKGDIKVKKMEDDLRKRIKEAWRSPLP